MSTVGFIRSSLKQMHNTYNDAIRRSVTRTHVLAERPSSISRVLSKDSAPTDSLTIANWRSIQAAGPAGIAAGRSLVRKRLMLASYTKASCPSCRHEHRLLTMILGEPLTGGLFALMPTLKNLRESEFMSQRDLATASGVSKATIAALELGQRRRPQWRTLRALAKALRVHPREIQIPIKN